MAEQGKLQNSQETLRVYVPSKTPLKYSSAGTRATSMQTFMGGAEIEENYVGVTKLPIDEGENLEAKFKSGVNRTDCPSCYGPASVTRRVINKTFSNSDAISSWVRNRGEKVK